MSRRRLLHSHVAVNGVSRTAKALSFMCRVPWSRDTQWHTYNLLCRSSQCPSCRQQSRPLVPYSMCTGLVGAGVSLH